MASSIPYDQISWISVRYVDKIIHIGVFGILGALVYRALIFPMDSPRFSWKRVALMLLIIIFYGASDEFHQSFVPGRSVDAKDLAADIIGGLTAGVGLYFLEKVRAAKGTVPTV